MKTIMIIVAGGSGTRMQQQTPKQWLPLGGIPLMMRTLHAFHQTSDSIELLVAMPEAHVDPWMDLCHQYRFHVPHLIGPSGLTRFETVRQSLQFLKDNGRLDSTVLIGVHDAARPLVLPEDIQKVLSEAETYGAAALAQVSTDSVRLVDLDGTNKNVERSRVYLMQTPQVFRSDLLWEAYQQSYDPAFTDDASVVEKMGTSIRLVEGDPRNLKITYPEHIAFAEQLLKLSGH